MKKKGMLKKVRNSFLGRVLCRLLGEEKGVAMLEYIILGLLIAAACVIGVSFFGHTATGMLGVLSAAMSGHIDKSDEIQTGIQSNFDANYEASQNYNSGKHNGSPAGNQDFKSGN